MYICCIYYIIYIICLYLPLYGKIIVKKDHIFLILLFSEEQHKELELDEALNLSLLLIKTFAWSRDSLV